MTHKDTQKYERRKHAGSGLVKRKGLAKPFHLFEFEGKLRHKKYTAELLIRLKRNISATWSSSYNFRAFIDISVQGCDDAFSIF